MDLNYLFTYQKTVEPMIIEISATSNRNGGTLQFINSLNGCLRKKFEDAVAGHKKLKYPASDMVRVLAHTNGSFSVRTQIGTIREDFSNEEQMAYQKTITKLLDAAGFRDCTVY